MLLDPIARFRNLIQLAENDLIGIRIGMFRGVSLISRAIKWRTRSIYSHAAILAVPYSSAYRIHVIEAWHRGGLIINEMREHEDFPHTPKTRIDVYDIDSFKVDAKAILEFSLRNYQRPYDFANVFRFLSRRKPLEEEPCRLAWFCSEFVTTALLHGGVKLFSDTEPPSMISPRDLSISPSLFNSGVKLLTP